MKQPPKDVWVTLAAIAGMVLLFVGVVWWPNGRAKAAHAERAQAAQERLAKIDASEAQRIHLERQVRDLESGLETDEHYVPRSPELSAMLRGLTESAQQAGVWEQEVGTSEFKRYADFSVVPATLSFESSFASALGVLRSIESQRRLTAVQRTEIDGRNPSASELRQGRSPVAFEVDLVSFYSTEEEDSP